MTGSFQTEARFRASWKAPMLVGAVAEEAQADVVGLAVLVGERHAERDRQVCADDGERADGADGHVGRGASSRPCRRRGRWPCRGSRRTSGPAERPWRAPRRGRGRCRPSCRCDAVPCRLRPRRASWPWQRWVDPRTTPCANRRWHSSSKYLISSIRRSQSSCSSIGASAVGGEEVLLVLISASLREEVIST